HNEENSMPRTSAILLADESLLVPLLQSLPELTVNITTGYPLTQSPIFGLIDLWLNVQDAISHARRKTVSFQQVETFLNHPLTKVAPTEHEALMDNIAEKQLFEIPLVDIHISSSTVPRFFSPINYASDLVSELTLLINYLLDSMALEDHSSQIDSNLLVETKKV